MAGTVAGTWTGDWTGAGSGILDWRLDGVGAWA